MPGSFLNVFKFPFVTCTSTSSNTHKNILKKSKYFYIFLIFLYNFKPNTKKRTHLLLIQSCTYKFKYLFC